MAKESRTEKETKRLLNILGENPSTRFIRFFSGLGVVSIIGSFIFYYALENSVGEKNKKRNCFSIQNHYVKSFYSKKSINNEFNNNYKACLKSSGSTFLQDSEKYCERIFKERFIDVTWRESHKKNERLDKIINNCSSILTKSIAPTITSVEKKIVEYNKKIKDHEQRLLSEDNKAIRIEKERWKVMKKSYEDSLPLLNGMIQ